MGRFSKWFYPGLSVKRWVIVLSISILGLSAGVALIAVAVEQLQDRTRSLASQFLNFLGDYALVLAGLVIIFSLVVMVISIVKINRNITGVFTGKQKKIVDTMYTKAQLSRGPNIVVFGGGTGLSMLLRGLKKYSTNITAVVTVADDGGSSGKIRGDMGVLPPGDIRNCLVALADTESYLEIIIQHRFTIDELKEHNLGNLILASLAQKIGFVNAIKELGKVLAVRGRVYPATLEPTISLRAKFKDGTEVVGETKIAQENKQIKKISIIPDKAEPLPETLQAIENADAIILGPGSLYTSIIPHFLVDGISDAIKNAKAPVYYICNVMTQKGETLNYTASDHIKALENHSVKNIADYIVLNNKKISDKHAKIYKELDNAEPVKIDEKRLKEKGVITLQEDLLEDDEMQVRHSSAKLAKFILGHLIKQDYRNKSFIDHYLLDKKLNEVEQNR
ncbi:gluconeogenesis factor YvcK family protein [Proteinivorax hydrogeniformans]|uniref:Putative gluconeogenesis factor n=1 Tax=Proteinivorax hydrogeniformans TaxID=1826727 RepID=A0AAU8HV26_9FIRM